MRNDTACSPPCAALPLPLPSHERTLPAILQHAAERFGDRPLVTLGGVSWSHRETAGIAARRAAALRAADVARTCLLYTSDAADE